MWILSVTTIFFTFSLEFIFHKLKKNSFSLFITKLFAIEIFLAIYEANLLAILSSSVVIIKPFNSFDDINSKIRDKKATLLISSFTDHSYEIINYTMTPEFQSLRQALAVHPPRMVSSPK